MSDSFNPVFTQSGSGASGSGTVTSVTLTGDGVVLSSTPSAAVTTSGTLTAALATAAANTVLGNATGSTAPPAYGQIVNGQIANTTIDLTAKVTGVLPPANGGVAVVSTSAQGGFFAGFGTSLVNGQSASNTYITSNNQVRCVRFVLPYKTTVTKITAGGGAGTAIIGDMGIYSADGTTLLANTGAVTYGVSAYTTTTILQTSVTLNPGVYVLAYTATLSTSTAQTYVANGTNTMTNSTAQCGTAANSATAGVLPSSLGVITKAALPNTALPQVFCEP